MVHVKTSEAAQSLCFRAKMENNVNNPTLTVPVDLKRKKQNEYFIGVSS